MARRINLDGITAFELSHGTLYNPASERHNGEYRFVGTVNHEQEWNESMPFDDDGNRWLETLGPGRLVFIPDEPPSDRT